MNSFKYFISLAPTTINILLPKVAKENKEVKIRCSISEDGFPKPYGIKYHIGNKTIIRETVSL